MNPSGVLLLLNPTGLLGPLKLLLHPWEQKEPELRLVGGALSSDRS